MPVPFVRFDVSAVLNGIRTGYRARAPAPTRTTGPSGATASWCHVNAKPTGPALRTGWHQGGVKGVGTAVQPQRNGRPMSRVPSGALRFHQRTGRDWQRPAVPLRRAPGCLESPGSGWRQACSRWVRCPACRASCCTPPIGGSPARHLPVKRAVRVGDMEACSSPARHRPMASASSVATTSWRQRWVASPGIADSSGTRRTAHPYGHRDPRCGAPSRRRTSGRPVPTR